MSYYIDKFSLKGKKALVTGGARGIGEAIARAFSEAGADIAVADIRTCSGSNIFFHKTDVTSENDLNSLINAIEKRWGRLDILVNAAGICINTPAENTTRDEWIFLVNINLNAVFFCSQAASRLMIQQKSGSIINIGSMSGNIVNYPQPQVSYNVSKAGVHMMTKSLAVEWARYNIRVNAIAPGYIETELTKPFMEKHPEDYKKYWVEGAVQRRIGKPEELTGAALYLASDASSYTTGAILTVDGGYSLR